MEKSEALKSQKSADQCPKNGEERERESEREREGARGENVKRIASTTISTGKEEIVDFLLLTGAPPAAKGTSEKVGHGSHELKAACCEMICTCIVST